ncbi:MAG: trk system potassium uptake protein TrkA [bacterium]|jgi:trk system potassium uptake protein TrkA
MKILIVGAGDTSFHIASQFTEENSEVTVVDEDAQLLKRLQRTLNVAVVQGSGTDLYALKKAGVADTDLFIACLEYDEINLVSCLLASQYAVKKKVAIIKTGTTHNKELIKRFKNAGINTVINTTKVVGMEILNTARIAAAAEVSSFANRRALMIGYRVKPESPLKNKLLREFPHNAGEYKFLVACIVRDGKSFIPRGDSQILEGDYVYIMLSRKGVNALNSFLKVKIDSIRHAVVAGDNILAQEVSHGLCWGEFKVTMICTNEWNAQQMNQKFKNSKHFHAIVGDCCDVKQLIRLDTSMASHFITTSDDDHLNITAGMVAHYLGAKKTIAIVNRQDLVDAAESVGVDVVISPRLSTARQVKKLMRGGEDSLDYTTISETNMEVMEMLAGENSEIVNKPLQQIHFPKECLMGIVINQKNEVIIPSGSTVIKAGDKVVVIAMPKSIIPLEELIEGEARKTITAE